VPRERQQMLRFPDPPGLSCADGKEEPVLWVRRLLIWHDISNAPIQDVPIRRGLNVIWSPTGIEPDAIAVGHAAGKTLFCRLLRYCLGEDSFADPEDTEAIRTKFPNGAVAAEVRLRGETWVVRRRFVTPRDDRARKGEEISELTDDGLRGSFTVFREELEKAIFDAEQNSLLADMEEVEDAWQYVLAWLTRDQECRIDGLTHWRHKDSSSHSPAHSASAETRLNVLRVAIGLYSHESSVLRKKILQAASLVKANEAAGRRLEARFEAVHDELATAFDLNVDQIWPPAEATEILQDRQQILESHRRRLLEFADQKIRSVRTVGIDPVHARNEQQYEILVCDLARIEQEIKNLESRHELKKQRAALLEDATARRWEEVREAKHPTCPYDGTPLDVEKSRFACPVPRLSDPAEARRIALETEGERKSILAELLAGQESLRDLRGEWATRAARQNALRRKIEAYGLTIASATKESQTAWSTKAAVRRLFELRAELENLLAATKEARAELKKLNDEQVASLSAFPTSKLQVWFDFLIRRVLSPEAHGTIVLDGHGLHPRINWRGNRRSVALNSLQIVLFDLAAMLCAAEGSSKTPAFLVHDSPREGDLDPWTYARLFEAIDELGDHERTAPFQYIVTTTTDPPEGRVRSTVRLRISADKDENRLFKVDL
jgi:hypothetical protein